MAHIQHQRMAWESARVVVAAIEAGIWPWLGHEMDERFGAGLRDRMIDSAVRIDGDPAQATAEAGLWRAVLADLLSSDPNAAAGLGTLMNEARGLMFVPVMS